MKPLLLALLLTVGLATNAAATDHAAVVAAMKNEGAQCRYYVELCGLSYSPSNLQAWADVRKVMLAVNGHEPKCEPDCKKAQDKAYEQDMRSAREVLGPNYKP